jgi:hypothetical protein
MNQDHEVLKGLAVLEELIEKKNKLVSDQEAEIARLRTSLRDSVMREQELHIRAMARCAEISTLKLENANLAGTADAYNHACEMLEGFQERRIAANKEPGCIGSLCGAMEWLYDRVERLESAVVKDAAMSQQRNEAMRLYVPPFKYKHGYIFDSDSQMFSDNKESEENDSIQQVRGWGRISKMKNGAKIQDEVGTAIAEALTAYWVANAPHLNREF